MGRDFELCNADFQSAVSQTSGLLITPLQNTFTAQMQFGEPRGISKKGCEKLKVTSRLVNSCTHATWPIESPMRTLPPFTTRAMTP